MRHGFKRLITIMAIGTAVLLTSGTGFATNGDIMIGQSAKSSSLAGATTAEPPDSTTILDNPAGLCCLSSRADIGAALFSPPRHAGYNSADLKSDSNLYTVPASGIVVNNGGKFAFGVGAYGISGMGVDFHKTNYSPTGPNGFAITNMGNIYSNLQHMEFGFGIAYKLNSDVTIGFTPIMVYQSLQMDMPFANNAMIQSMLGSPTAGAAITPMTLDQQSALGIRFAAGINYRPTDRLVLGLAYKSKSFMSKFKWNTDNFGQVKMKLESPRIIAFGISYTITPKLRIEADEKFIDYKSVMDTVDIVSDKPGAFSDYTMMVGMMKGTLSSDGKTLVYPFKWKNQWVSALGIEYKANRRLALRAGFNYAKNPIRNEYLLANIPSMALAETHVSVGASYRLTPRAELSLAYVHAFGKTENNSDPNTQAMLKSLKMHQDTLSMEFSYLF